MPVHPGWPDRLTESFARRRGGRRLRRARRLVALGCFLTAGVLALLPPRSASAGVAVIALTRDLTTGSALIPADLTTVRVASPPDGAVRAAGDLRGRLLGGPARRGEIVTDARLVPVGGGPTPGPGRVAVPVRPDDPGAVALLHPGVHLAVIAVDAAGVAQTIATDAVVLDLPPPADTLATTKRLVVLGVPAGVADRLAAAAAVQTIAFRFT